MRNFSISLTFAAFFISFPAYGGQPAVSLSAENQPDSLISKKQDASMRDMLARRRFAPMWVPVRMCISTSNAAPSLPAPSAAYSMIWQPRGQEKLGLSDKQKESLIKINKEVVAKANCHVEKFKKLSPEEQTAEVKKWAGKPSPWRQQLDNQIRSQVESVLTPSQLQTLKDYSFCMRAVGLLYRATIRQEIGFSPEQEKRLRHTIRERLARFQKVSLKRAENIWAELTPKQQSMLPEVVKRQGPTSAVLSMAWELGFDFNCVPDYPMLTESPVRECLGLSVEQEEQLQALMANCGARAQKRLPSKKQPSKPEPDWEADAKKQVEAILTPQQLTMLNEINFHRQVALALCYPEKSKKVGITAQQTAEFQRLDKENLKHLYCIDDEALAKVMKMITPRQREKLRDEIKRNGGL